MPELPEVEYTRERLTTWLARGRVTKCEVLDARLVRPVRPAIVARAILGRTITRVDRRGKWLRIVLDDGTFLFVHLAMTGWFELAPSEASLRHERARITVVRGRKTSRAAYVDARRWGRWIHARADIEPWTSLGPDPLHEKIDVVALHKKLARRKTRSIKEALLDQSLLAGVGNIQAAEALWKAQIDPRSRASSITGEQLAAIVRGIQWTIARTLKDLAKGDKGDPDPWFVYGHKGQPCPRCRTLLERIELGGRTTTFCPGCQR